MKILDRDDDFFVDRARLEQRSIGGNLASCPPEARQGASLRRLCDLQRAGEHRALDCPAHQR
jgi:hypothetical protein